MVDFLCRNEFSASMTDIADCMRLYLITDDSARSPADLTDRVERGIAGGVTAVQFREKNGGPTICSRAFESLSKACEKASVPLFLNADLLGRFELNGPLAGIQYSDRTLPPHPDSVADLVGYSAHAADEAQKAFSHNVDFCTLSPIFATPSKVGILNPIGMKAIRKARNLLPGNVIVALGGINESNAEQCIRAGATGVAVIRAIMAADDPEKAARRLMRIIENSFQL